MCRIAVGCYIALSAFVVGRASADEVWESVAAVAEVTVRVHWVSTAELTAAARRLGKRPDGKAMAFSVLRKDTKTGIFVCDIYSPYRPARLQDRATASLGHEAAHCLGFSHE
jgi:hypothetical protein